MIVILFGAPGAGKGTQARYLGSRYGLERLATGDLLRAETAAGTKLGKAASRYISEGRLVPDDLVTAMVTSRMENRVSGNFLLDGFPRNLDQAEALSRFLGGAGAFVDLAVFLNIPASAAHARLSSRRICSHCGAVFNAATCPPKVEGVCDECGGNLISRQDDGDKTAARRFEVYERDTRPLVAFYKKEGICREVDATRSPEKVSEDISRHVDPIFGKEKEKA